MRSGQAIYVFLIVAVLLGCPSSVLAAPKSKLYEPVNSVAGTGNENIIKFQLNKNDKKLDISKSSPKLRIRLDARVLAAKISYPQSYQVKTFIYDHNGQENILSITSPTIVSNKQARNSSFIVSLERLKTSSDVYFDLYDSSGAYINTYKSYIEIINSNLSSNANRILDNAACDNSQFGECQIKYFFDNVKFEVFPSKTIKTMVWREDDGKYNVSIPTRRITKKAIRKGAKSIGNSNGSAGYSSTDFVPNLNFGNGSGSYAGIDFNHTTQNLGFSFNGNQPVVIIQSAGKLGIGVDPISAFLDLRGGDGVTPSMRFNPGQLSSPLLNGALEYDGTNLYFTTGGNREKIAFGTPAAGIQGPQGPAGPTGAQGPAGANGGFDGSNAAINGILSFVNGAMLQTAKFNGSTLFSNNSITQFNGNILIPSGASLNYVLASDVNGYASWRALPSLPSNGDDLGNHTATQNLNMASYKIMNSIMQATRINGSTLFSNNSIAQFNGQVALANKSSAPAATEGFGKLFVNGNDLYFIDNGGTQTNLLTGNPAGSDTQIQFNNAGVFGASTDLTWNGNSLDTRRVRLDDGSSSAPSFGFKSSSSGMFNDGVGGLGFSINGATRFAINSIAGNVGIGYLNPTAKLQVNGDLSMSTGHVLVNGGTLADLGIKLKNNNSGIYTQSANGMALVTGATEKLSIKNDGNIGISKTNPTQKLEVNGNVLVNNLIGTKSLYNNSSGANVAVNWNNGNRQIITLNTNVTFSFTDPAVGTAHLSLMLVQDATGSRTVTWPATVKWPGGSAPVLTTIPSSVDIVTCIFANSTYYCQIGLDFK